MPFSDFESVRPERILVCLDTVQALDARDPGPAPDAARRANNGRRILQFARDKSWGVAHVMHHSVRTRRSRAIEGLEPLQSEPVHYRTGVSAFSNRRFRESLEEAQGAELVILSLFLSRACLATALAARDRGLTVTLVGDVIDGSADAAAGLDAIQTLSQSLAAPFVNVLRTDELIDMRELLHLVS
jgi:nicotinamidase-related amidase